MIFDWKEDEVYGELRDIIEPKYTISDEDDLSDMSGLVLHNACLDNQQKMIESAVNNRLPIFIVGRRPDIFGDVLDIKYNYENYRLHYDYVSLKRDIREIFG